MRDSTIPLDGWAMAFPSHPFDEMRAGQVRGSMAFAAAVVYSWAGRFGKLKAKEMIRSTNWPEAIRLCLDTAWGG